MKYALLIVEAHPNKTEQENTEAFRKLMEGSQCDTHKPERLNDSVLLYAFPDHFLSFATHIANAGRDGFRVRTLFFEERPAWITSEVAS